MSIKLIVDAITKASNAVSPKKTPAIIASITGCSHTAIEYKIAIGTYRQNTVRINLSFFN